MKKTILFGVCATFAIMPAVAMALVLDTKAKNGWKDIEVGGPGMGPFPKFRYNVAKYVRK